MSVTVVPRDYRPFSVGEFRGVDLTTQAANVAAYRSPDALNMTRESRGKVRKRTGWTAVKDYPARINGVHKLHAPDRTVTLIHAGTALYDLDGEDDTPLYEGMADERSQAVQCGGKLVIFDGLRALVYDGETVVPLDTVGKTPVILISKDPEGGGQTLDPVNILSPKRTEAFYVGPDKASEKVFHLSAQGIDSTPVTVEAMQSDGSFTEVTGFTVDRPAGTVTFNTAPGASPVLGIDNIKVTYAKTIEGYADKINKCRVAFLYGENGAQDRIFAAGNPDAANTDWYCESGDPTMWGDLWYSVIGEDGSRIMGYSAVGELLATHLDRSAGETNVVMREPSILDDKPVFRLAGSVQGPGTVSSFCFGVLEGEPLFLTREGIFALTSSDIAGRQLSQLRSYYLNGKLLMEDLTQAAGFVHDGLFVLSVGGFVYVLDGQQTALEPNAPYSNRQFEGYLWDNVPARVWWSDDEGRLCFGTAQGRLCRFYADASSPDSFTDDETTPVSARWTTPPLYGQWFDSELTFRKIAVQLGAAARTGVRVWMEYDGLRELVMEYSGMGRYFSYALLSYENFSYRADHTPQNLRERLKIKRTDGVVFALTNEKAEPFALYRFGTEYYEDPRRR